MAILVAMACGPGDATVNSLPAGQTQTTAATSTPGKTVAVSGRVVFKNSASKARMAAKDAGKLTLTDLKTKQEKTVSLSADGSYTSEVADGDYFLQAVSTTGEVLTRIQPKVSEASTGMNVDLDTTTKAVYLQSSGVSELGDMSTENLKSKLNEVDNILTTAQATLTNSGASNAEKSAAMSALCIKEKIQAVNAAGEGDKLLAVSSVVSDVSDKEKLKAMNDDVLMAIIKDTGKPVTIKTNNGTLTLSSVQEVVTKSAEIEASISPDVRVIRNSANKQNSHPVADAGENMFAAPGATVQLDGSNSYDADGDTLTYAWEQFVGESASLSSLTAAKPTFVMPVTDKKLKFKLRVHDGQIHSETSIVEVYPQQGESVTVSDVIKEALRNEPSFFIIRTTATDGYGVIDATDKLVFDVNKEGVVTAAKFIGDGSGLTNLNIGTVSVGSSQITDGSITAADIQNGAIIDAKLAQITATNKVAATAVEDRFLRNDGNDSTSGIITATGFKGDGSGLTNLPVSSLATTAGGNIVFSGNVVAAAFAGDGSKLTNLSISAASVTSSQILDGTITAADIKDGAITDGKLAQITTANKVAASAVEDKFLRNDQNDSTSGAITANAFIGDGSGLTNVRASTVLTDASGNVTIQGNVIAAEFSGDGSRLTNLNVSSVSVDSSQIVDGAITAADIQDGAIDSAKISANAVGPEEIQSSGVTAGTYGSTSQVAQITVDEDGRITSAANAAIAASPWIASGGNVSLSSGNVNVVIAGGLFASGGNQYGNMKYTHVALGGNPTTGTSGQNYQYATIGGGLNNTASCTGSTVGGGYNNTASAGTDTVCGGHHNTASGGHSIVCGGDYNSASGAESIVGGGYSNTASGGGAVVAGGTLNTASKNHATIGGGYANTTSNTYATVAGGYTNIASGQYSTIPGGANNVAAGTASFAAGKGMYATSSAANTFVWGAVNSGNTQVSAPDSFVIFPNEPNGPGTGRLAIGTTAPAQKLHLSNGNALIDGVLIIGNQSAIPTTMAGNGILFTMSNNLHYLNSSGTDTVLGYGNVGTNSITSSEILDGAVSSAEISSGSVTSAKLDTNLTLTGNMIVNGLTSNSGLVQAGNTLVSGNVTAGRFYGDGSGLTNLNFSSIGNISISGSLTCSSINVPSFEYPHGKAGTEISFLLNTGNTYIVPAGKVLYLKGGSPVKINNSSVGYPSVGLYPSGVTLSRASSINNYMCKGLLVDDDPSIIPVNFPIGTDSSSGNVFSYIVPSGCVLYLGFGSGTLYEGNTPASGLGIIYTANYTNKMFSSGCVLYDNEVLHTISGYLRPQ